MGVGIGLFVLRQELRWGYYGSVLDWWAAHVTRVLLCTLPALFFFGGGLGIWWRSIDWSPQRCFGVLATGLALLLSLVLAGLFGLISESAQELALLVTSSVGAGVALIVVGRICWEPAEGPAVPCPKCGYDLRGQQECRCPECGTQFTVGELTRREPAETV